MAPPGRLAWSAFIAANLAMHLAALCLGLLLVAIAAGAPVPVVVGLGAALASLTVYALHVRPRPLPVRSGPPGPSFRLLTANLNWRAESHGPALAKLAGTGSDLVVIQEATAATRRELEHRLAHLPHRLGAGHSHVMVMSRWPLHPAGAPALPGAAHRGLDLRVAHPAGALRLLALHLQVPRRPRDLGPRRQQLEWLAGRLRSGEPGPMLVVGDLNASPWSWSLAQLVRRFGLATAVPAWPWRATWPASAGWFGLQLDHVLVRGPLARGRGRVHRLPGSDHRALEVDLFPLG
jgi:endonuclease/exonuclease/phosphatase (EEP) superfamily protein YafD